MTDKQTSTIPSVVRILSFDPSIGEMGWCVQDFDIVKNEYHIIKTGTLYGLKLIKNDKILKERFSKSFCILHAYEKIIQDLMVNNKPHFTVTESAFHYRYPQVLASLTLIIHTIRKASKNIFVRDIYQIAPMETKKEICQNHMAGKDDIKENILNMENITFSSDCDVEAMTEHEFDAIGHGICFSRRYLPTALTTMM